MTLSETLILFTYFFVLVILAVYGWHRYYLVYVYMRHKDRQPVPQGALASLPVVTIQLPIYNEMYVADRLIDAVCQIDYPRELLEVQVLDDSTDETRSVAERAVRRNAAHNLCSSALVFEGDGVVREYVGGYSDWKRVAGRRSADSAPVAPSAKPKAAGRGAVKADPPKKLAFSERRELEELPKRIEALEKEIGELHAHMADPEYYKRDPAAMKRAVERTRAAEAEIEAAFGRWAELGERAG
jgi:cellulose synthase/poly-beta-1,6-N-acetylglucosamine synthase-like glycosyltransferase